MRSCTIYVCNSTSVQYKHKLKVWLHINTYVHVNMCYIRECKYAPSFCGTYMYVCHILINAHVTTQLTHFSEKSQRKIVHKRLSSEPA